MRTRAIGRVRDDPELQLALFGFGIGVASAAILALYAGASGQSLYSVSILPFLCVEFGLAMGVPAYFLIWRPLYHDGEPGGDR